MDTETRLSNLEARIEKLEILAAEMRTKAESAIDKLSTHPLLSTFAKFLK